MTEVIEAKEPVVSYDTIDVPMVVTLQESFDFFNERLWGSDLPPVVIVLVRKKEQNGGHYSPGRWRMRDAAQTEEEAREYFRRALESHGCIDPNGWDVSEIGLNVQSWPYYTDAHILSVLVHEMVHHWQHYRGENQPRGGYHNREWGTEMKRVGLYPSSTGEEGGRETGQQMSHYVMEGGLFEEAVKELLSGGVKLEYDSPKPNRPKAPKSKWKYTCPMCKQNAWAKEDRALICGDCRQNMRMEEGDE